MARVVKKKKRTVTRPPVSVTYKGSVRHFAIKMGLPTPEDIRGEMSDYREVLMGHVDPPLQKGVLTLMEVSNAYFSRACEWEQLILQGKAEGWVSKEDGYESLRTQEIRSFKELCKGATELGSRRVTYENARVEKELRGLESM